MGITRFIRIRFITYGWSPPGYWPQGLREATLYAHTRGPCVIKFQTHRVRTTDRTVALDAQFDEAAAESGEQAQEHDMRVGQVTLHYVTWGCAPLSCSVPA
jgi:hypothetical protein